MLLVPCPSVINARLYPQRTAIAWSGRSLAWESLNNYIHSTSRYLKEIAVCSKARVLIVHDDSPGYIIALLALWRIGAVVYPAAGHASLEQAAQALELVKPVRAIGPRKARKMWGACGRWADLEQVVAYGYNDSFLGSEASLDPKIDMDAAALLRLAADQGGGVRVEELTHTRLRNDPEGLAGLFNSLATGEALVL